MGFRGLVVWGLGVRGAVTPSKIHLHLFESILQSKDVMIAARYNQARKTLNMHVGSGAGA